MNVSNFVQCSLVTPVATNTTELVLTPPVAPYAYPPLEGGTLVITDSVARPSFYEVISYTHRIDNVLYGVVRAKEGTTARAWTGVTWIYQALTAADYIAALLLKANAANAQLTGIPTAPTAALGTNTDQIATMAAVQAAIAALLDSSPAALDTLNELAAALGDDPNFAATMNAALAGKEPTIVAGTAAQMWLGNKTWATVLSQVQGTLLTGLGAGSNTTIVSTDTLIAALAKIQNQLNNKAASNDSRLSDSREWTADTVTQAVAEAGTDTTRTAWTAQRVAQAVRGGLLTGLNLTVATAVAATDTVLVGIGKLQKQITDIGTNLAGNVRATVLTGYLVGTDVDVAATDSLLVAIQKLQGQINARAPLTGTGASGSWGISISGSSASCTGNAATATTLSGLTASVTELNYVDGVTSAIQTQLNAKAPLTGAGTSGTWPINVSGTAASLGGFAVGGLQEIGRYLDFHNSANGYDYDVRLEAGAGGSAGAGTFYVTAAGGLVCTGNLTAYSDIRLKTDIEVIPEALMKVMALRGVTYTRRDNGERQTGVIAQEVQAVIPEAVLVSNDEEATLSVAYGNLVGLLIEAIKELNLKVEALENGTA